VEVEMNVEIRSRTVSVSEALRGHVDRKLAQGFRRFDERVRSVMVRLVDLNGPRGGVDKRCRILARVAPTAVIVVEATDADVYVAVSQAVLRLEDRLARLGSRRVRSRARGPRRGFSGERRVTRGATVGAAVEERRT
jgi:ribosomal subunit interface protein